jgi:hypothetical protein
MSEKKTTYELEGRTIYKLEKYEPGARYQVDLFDTSELAKDYLKTVRDRREGWLRNNNYEYMPLSPEEGYILTPISLKTEIVQYEVDPMDAMLARSLSARRRVAS